MGRQRAWALTLTVTGLFLAGCGGSGDREEAGTTAASVPTTAEPTVEITGEPTVEPTMEPTVEPTPEADLGPYPMPLFVPAAMESDSVEGAKAFLYYFVDVANHARSYNDAEAMLFYCHEASIFCQGMAEVMNDAAERGLTHRGAKLSIVQITSAEDLDGSGTYYSITGDFESTAGVLLDATGEVVDEESEAQMSATAIVERRDDGYWVLHEFGKTEEP